MSKVDPYGVCGEQVDCNSVQCTKSVYVICNIIIVLMCLGKWAYYRVGMSLSVEHVLVKIVQWRKS